MSWLIEKTAMLFLLQQRRSGPGNPGAAGPVGQVHEPAIRMHVNRPQSLPGSNVWGSLSVSLENRGLRIGSVFQPLEYVELVLPFSEERSRAATDKVQVPALKIKPSAGGNRKPVRQQSIIVGEYFSAPGSSGLVVVGPLRVTESPYCSRDRRTLVTKSPRRAPPRVLLACR